MKKHVTNKYCRMTKITPGNETLGALYDCIGGSSEAVKIFINEQLGSGQVENVKFMWNDWTSRLLKNPKNAIIAQQFNLEQKNAR